MNTAQDLFAYAQQHNIRLSPKDDQLSLNAPREALTHEFIESVKAHKQELILIARINDACNGLDITPEQLIRVLTREGKRQVIEGELYGDKLRKFARNVDGLIKDGILKFYIDTIDKLKKTS